ncbi:MAG: phage tail tape measure protein, partial [Lachnospiraceae bacterium]|nr:phage tail tape measure protein [Lachnospiraceae bacterium]
EGNYRDLTDILMDVESAVDGMGSAERAAALKSTFTADSTKGLNLLLNEGIGDIAGYEEALRGCEGAAEDMAETMNDNLRGDMANLNSAWEEFQLKIYDKAEPALRSITQFVTNDVIPAATWLLNHLPELGIVLSAIAGVVVAAKWGAIVAKISMIQKGVMGLMAVLGGISAPVVAVIAVVAGLALAFMHLWRTNEEFRNNIIAIWNGIKEKFDSFMEGILERVNALGFDFEDVTSMMKAAWDGLCSVLAPVFEIAFTTVANVLSAALDILTGLFDVFSGIFTGDWSLMWQGITEVLNGFLELDTALIRAAFNVFKNIASGAWNAIKSATAKVWASITSTISKKLESAKNAVRNAFNTIKTTIASIGSGVLGKVAGTFSSIYSSIKSKIDAARNAVRNAISGIKSAMRFSWSLPHLKLPHVTIKGKFSLDPPSVPKFGISWYKKGAILNQPTIFGAIGNQLQAGGEAGKEAVLPLAELWKKMKQIMLEVFDAVSTTGGSPETTLVTQASKLVTMDDFSLGGLSGAGGTTIIYDFTGFSWSPTLNINGKGDEDDIMDKLRAHEAEFFDWLDEFIHLREVACYE